MTKFKQPILFRSRVIDLAEIMEHLEFETMEDLHGEGFFSPAQWLKSYDIAAGYTGMYIHFIELMKERFDIDFPKLKYGKLLRPLALDNRTGDLYQIVSAEYNRAGIVTSIIAREGDTIKYIYNDLPQTNYVANSRKTELVLLYDGWY